MDTFKKIDPKLEIMPTLYSQDGNTNPTAYLHFFNPLGRGDWYATEMRKEGDDVLFFGYVKSPIGEDCDEWGYFTLNQLKDTKIIELDLWFEPTPIKEVI